LQREIPVKVGAFVLITTAMLVEKSLAQTIDKPVSSRTTLTSQQNQSDPLAREALVAFNRGDWEAAIRAYEKLVKLSPGVAESFLNLGVAYYSSRHPQDAVQPLRKALKLKPSLTQARYYLGASLAGSGQCEEALPYLKKDTPRASEKHLKYEMGLAGVRCSVALNQPDDAVEFVRILRREFPDDPEVLYQTVHVYSDLSTRASQELIFKAPTSYQVHQLNAEALEAQGKWEEAAKEYRAILEKNARQEGIHYRLGRLILSAPKNATTLADAKKQFEEELKINPSNAGAEYVLGELAFQAAELDRAIEHFSRAVKLEPGFADAFLELGRALIAAGQVAEAVTPLETAVKLQPENPLTHFHLSTAYTRLGRSEEAKRESALHKELDEKMRRTREEVQKAVSGVPPEEPSK
jgi:tetratricopeptide (TPR) repeat protein